VYLGLQIISNANSGRSPRTFITGPDDRVHDLLGIDDDRRLIQGAGKISKSRTSTWSSRHPLMCPLARGSLVFLGNCVGCSHVEDTRGRLVVPKGRMPHELA